MKFGKTIVTAMALGSLAYAAPAAAWSWGGWSVGHSHYSGCGHWGHKPPKPDTPKTPEGGSSSSGGTSVPEPGMLGLFGATLLGLGLARRRRIGKTSD